MPRRESLLLLAVLFLITFSSAQEGTVGSPIQGAASASSSLSGISSNHVVVVMEENRSIN